MYYNTNSNTNINERGDNKGNYNGCACQTSDQNFQVYLMSSSPVQHERAHSLKSIKDHWNILENYFFLNC